MNRIWLVVFVLFLAGCSSNPKTDINEAVSEGSVNEKTDKGSVTFIGKYVEVTKNEDYIELTADGIALIGNSSRNYMKAGKYSVDGKQLLIIFDDFAVKGRFLSDPRQLSIKMTSEGAYSGYSDMIYYKQEGQ